MGCRKIKSSCLCALLLIITNVVVAAPQSKPQSPINVSIIPLTELVPDHPIQFEISITSKAPSSNLKLMITTPGDMQLMAGDYLEFAVEHGDPGDITLSAQYTYGGFTKIA